jgi:hypothetical protein
MLSTPILLRQLRRIGVDSCIGNTIRNVVMLGIGVSLIHMLGQGCLGMVSTNVISHWWVRWRGTILGIGGVLSSLPGSGTPPSIGC